MAQKIGLEAILDMADFNKGLKQYNSGIDEMETKTDKGAGVLGRLGGGLLTVAKVGITAAATGFLALGGVIASSVKEAAAAQQVEAQLEAVLKSTGGAAGMTKDEILGLADALSQVTPFEDDVIASAETMLLQFKNIGEDVFPQATEMALDLATRLGIDASSAAKLLGKALEEPGEGLTRLRQAGVAFTDEQEAMIQAMVAAGDTAGAQKFIMDELEKSVGGAARAAGETFAGKMEIMRNSIGNVKESIGAAFLPVLQQLVDKFTQFVVENGPQIQAFFQAIADWITTKAIPALVEIWNWLATNLPIAIQMLSNFWTTVLQPALAAVWSFISTSVIPILQKVWDWLATNLPPALQTLATFWNTILLPALKAVWSFISTSVIPILQKVWDWLATNLPPALQTLADFWNNTLLPAIKAVWQFIKTYLVPLFEAVANVVIAVLKKEIEFLAALWKNVLQPALEAVWLFIKDNIIPIFERIVAFIVETLGPKFLWLKSNILDPVSGAFAGIGGAIKDIIGFLVDLANKIGSIQLPSWMQPGSPTPWELGLRGIGQAMRELARTQLPDLQAGLNLTAGGMSMSRQGFAPALATAGSTVNVNFGDTNISSGLDAATFQAQVLQTVTRAVQGY